MLNFYFITNNLYGFLGKEFLEFSNGYVCRLWDCFLLDQQRVTIHCQTSVHYTNYTTMCKMNNATSEGKKRDFDKVNKNVVATGDDTVIENDSAVITMNNIKTESQEAITDSEVC